MTDDEILKLYNEMVDYYGESLPNYEHEPIRFAYYVRNFRYYKSRQFID